jgi:hypothetical protein
MRFARTLRRGTAACLVALLGVLGTGLPSHHHESPEKSAQTAANHVLNAEHHSHGTVLVEQAERVQSNAPQLGPAPVQWFAFATPGIIRPVAAAIRPLRPLERGPPPGAPRAPPRVFLT